MDEDSIVILNSVQGIEYVRPPTLDFLKVKENEDYTEYKVITKKNAKEKAKHKKGCSENPFTNYLDSFIFCNPTLTIQVPKKTNTVGSILFLAFLSFRKKYPIKVAKIILVSRIEDT